MFECPVCGEENFQEDARQGYCSNCRAFTRVCSIGLCDDRPAVTAGNVALCRPHADEIGWEGVERDATTPLPNARRNQPATPGSPTPERPGQ